MEILHFVHFTIIVAVAAVVHSDPYHTHGLAKLCTTAGELWLGYALYESFDIASSWVQAVGTVACVRVPYQPVAVNIETRHLVANIFDGLGLLTVREGHDFARLGAGKDVVAVGGQTGDVLVEEVTATLQRVVRHVHAVDTLVGAYPQVVMITLHNAVHLQLVSGNELLLRTVTVQAQLIKAHILIGYQHVTAAGDVGVEEIVDDKLLMTANACQRVLDAVGLAVDDKHLTVVHLQPYVLRLVNGNLVHTVVQTAYATGNTCLVVVEVVAVES